jgi:hypothetical protein
MFNKQTGVIIESLSTGIAEPVAQQMRMTFFKKLMSGGATR